MISTLQITPLQHLSLTLMIREVRIGRIGLMHPSHLIVYLLRYKWIKAAVAVTWQTVRLHADTYEPIDILAASDAELAIEGA